MGVIKDISGQRFDRWLVLRLDCVDSKQGAARWIMRCDCGTERSVLAKSVIKGDSRSCGCIQKLEAGLASARHVYRSYRAGARKRKIEFHLTFQEFLDLTSAHCRYCGVDPQQILSHGANGYNGDYIYNGIDRLDSTLDYAVDNCVPCCGICNMMKSTMSYEQFVTHCSRVVNHIAQ